MKGKKNVQQGNTIDKDTLNVDAEMGSPIQNDELKNQSFGMNTYEHLAGVFGYTRLLRRDMNMVKEQMKDLRREFDHLSNTSQRELTLSQHLDKLTEVIGNVEEVTNMMKRVPPLEMKSRDIDHLLRVM